jgi:hypothetical protein
MKRASYRDSQLAIEPKSLRYKSRGRGTMREIDDIYASHGTVDGQPALVHAEYDVENFPNHQELAGGHQVSRLKPA